MMKLLGSGVGPAKTILKCKFVWEDGKTMMSDQFNVRRLATGQVQAAVECRFDMLQLFAHFLWPPPPTRETGSGSSIRECNAK